MKKWNELRDYLIQCLIQTEIDNKHEVTKELKEALAKMDELDKKYFKKRKSKFDNLTQQDIKESVAASERSWRED